MHGKLYILSGASGSGKTTLLNNICGIGCAPFDDSLEAVRAPKYSERKRRNENDDIIHVERVDLDNFDLAYVINNTRYGLRYNEILELLATGRDAFIVLSDFRVVRRVKDALGDKARAIYISSAIDADRLRRIQQERHGFSPDENQKKILAYHFARAGAAARLDWWDKVSKCVGELEADWRAYATDARSTEIRAEKIRTFHIKYIEHINLFDHVILNYTEDKPEEMSEQARSILRGAKGGPAGSVAHPPIFVVAAASGAGKGTLIETLNLIAKDEVKIVSKVALRRPKDGDRRDGMLALLREDGDPEPRWPEWWSDSMIRSGEAGQIPDDYDLRWSFHAGSTEYAISHQEVERNLEAGRPQIFVSNMNQFDRFRELWPDNVVFVYLHRLITDEDHRTMVKEKWADDPEQARVRILERREVHEDYLLRIGEFHHVLLNTTYQEDLYDQMFSILESYRSSAVSAAA